MGELGWGGGGGGGGGLRIAENGRCGRVHEFI